MYSNGTLPLPLTLDVLDVPLDAQCGLALSFFLTLVPFSFQAKHTNINKSFKHRISMNILSMNI